MNDVFSGLFFIFLAAMASFFITWAAAHETVATECERLGAFYVGQKVYECKLKGQP